MVEPISRNSDARQRLGRGLAALLGDAKQDVEIQSGINAKQIPIEFIRSNARNPRQAFAETELEELAASIRERGIIQPIIVRPVTGAIDTYEIVAGERRWRAAQRAGLHVVPVVSVSLSDREALELSIIENIQRADLNALEEARGYAQLASDHGYSHADIGKIVGKSRSHVANTLRLLGLPEHTRKLLATGAISAGHARALLALPEPDTIADRVVARGLTVRDVEKLSEASDPSPATSKPEYESDPVTLDLQNRLSLKLGVKTVIQYNGRRKELKIRFKDLEQLEFICDCLLRN